MQVYNFADADACMFVLFLAQKINEEKAFVYDAYFKS